MNMNIYFCLQFNKMETVRVIWRVFLLVFCQTVISTGVSLTSYLLGYIVDLTETGNDIYGGIVFYSVTVIIVAATIMVRERVRCNAVNGLRHRLRRVLIDGIFCGDLQEHGKQKHGEYYAVIDGQVGEFSYDAVQIVLKTAEIIVSVFVTMYLLFSESRRGYRKDQYQVLRPDISPAVQYSAPYTHAVPCVQDALLLTQGEFRCALQHNGDLLACVPHGRGA